MLVLNFQQNPHFDPTNEDNLFVKLILLALNSCSLSLLRRTELIFYEILRWSTW